SKQDHRLRAARATLPPFSLRAPRNKIASCPSVSRFPPAFVYSGVVPGFDPQEARGMGKMPYNGRDDANRRPQGASAAMRDLKDWFIREVLPLESALMQFLRQNWRDKADIADLRQDVYVRVFEAAQKQIPDTAK